MVAHQKDLNAYKTEEDGLKLKRAMQETVKAHLLSLMTDGSSVSQPLMSLTQTCENILQIPE